MTNKPIEIVIYYNDKEDAEKAIELKKDINKCSHISLEVYIKRKVIQNDTQKGTSQQRDY